MDQHSSPTNEPRDRGGLLTEQRHPRSMNLDTLTIEACVRLINEEDRQVAIAVGEVERSICALLVDVLPRMQRGGRLIYIGAGTSGRLGVLDASECPPTFQSPPEQVQAIIAGGDAALRRSSESKEDDPDGARAELDAISIGEADTLLGIAAGGTTPYVLGALELASRRGCATGLLTCVPIERPSTVGHLIFVRTGPEIVTGSTRMKAGTATKLVLNTISTTLMIQLGKVYENLMVDLRASNDKLRDRAARIVMELTGLDRGAALKLLDHADGEAKVAIVMHRRGLDRSTARQLINRAGGRLRGALEMDSDG